MRPGHLAIVYNRAGGITNNTLSEGINIIVPWFQRTVDFDIRTRPQQVNSQSGSKGNYLSLYNLLKF